MNIAQISGYEKKLISWAAGGVLVFLFAFLWAPSRDGLQVVFLFSLFIPLCLFYIKHPRKILLQNKINSVALLYAAYASISSLWGEAADLGYFAFIFFVLFLWLSSVSLVYLYGFSITSKQLLYFCCFGAIFSIANTAYYHFFVKFITVFDNRVWGWNVFRNPNEFGAACGVISLVAFSMGLQLKSIWRAYGLFSIAAFCFIGLLASFSRSALLAYAITAIFALLIIRPAFKIWAPLLIAAFLSLICAFILLKLHIYFQGRGDLSGGRIVIWSYLFDHINDYFWFGKGMSKDTATYIPSLDLSLNHMHSAWLDTLYRTGFLGLVLILWHAFEIIRRFSLSPVIFPFFIWWMYGTITMMFDGRCIFWEMGAKWFLYWIPAAFIAAAVSKKIPIEEP